LRFYNGPTADQDDALTNTMTDRQEWTAMTQDQIPMTRDDYDRKKSDLDKLQAKLTEVTHQVADARAMGDLSENAEYHAAREIQGQVQAKINDTRDELSRAYIVDLASLPKDTVVLGSRVKVKDLDGDEEEEYYLVGSNPDPLNNKILTGSPIGQGLLGKKKGDVAAIQAPRGTIRLQILEISFG
jgi:transcription elongation factor GreA